MDTEGDEEMGPIDYPVEWPGRLPDGQGPIPDRSDRPWSDPHPLDDEDRAATGAVLEPGTAAVLVPPGC